MGKFKQVLVLEAESGKDKKDVGGKYRMDSPWLVEAFKNAGVESSILFIKREDTLETLKAKYPDTAFLGRVNPMDYKEISLDEYIKLLSDLEKAGLLLGPTPDQMDRLGAKSILYDLADSSMGVKGVFYHKYDDIKNNPKEFDRILPNPGPARVIKMLRGSTGLGVWKLANKDDKTVILTDAYTQKSEDIARDKVCPKFCELCAEDAISMPFLPLIVEGEFRFLMSRHEILEVIHKKPQDAEGFTATLRSGAKYTILDPKEHKPVMDGVIKWSRDLLTQLKMPDAPYWWSVDCIEEAVDKVAPNEVPSSNAGRKLVLSEINCSCLGLVADTSPEAAIKGKQFAKMIADIVLK
jgi:hypothetical protein